VTVALLETGGREPFPFEFMPSYNGGSDFYTYHGASGGRRQRIMGGRAMGGSAAVNGGAYTRAAAGDFPWLSPEEVIAGYKALEADMPRVLVSPTWEEEMPLTFRALSVGLMARVGGNLHWRLDPHREDAPTARISGFYRSQVPWVRQQKEPVPQTASTDTEFHQRVPTLAHADDANYRRWSARLTPYNHLVRAWPPEGLAVFANTTARRVLLKGGRAVGVETMSGSVFRARREVFLCAGALETPKLLHASRLAPGKNGVGIFPFQDHRSVWLHLNLEGIAPEDPQLRVMIAFLNVSWPTTASPHAPAEFELYITERSCAHSRDWSCMDLGAILLHPTSPGRLLLRPGADPEIELPLERADRWRFRRLFDFLSKAYETASEFLEPGTRRLLMTDELMRAFLHAPAERFEEMLVTRLFTWNHPTGTVPVGLLLDERFRFLGVQGLRVADASALPLSSSGHTDAAAQLVGHLAARYAGEERSGLGGSGHGRNAWTATGSIWAPPGSMRPADRQ